MKKKLLSFILTLVMLLTMLPASLLPVFAEEEIPFTVKQNGTECPVVKDESDKVYTVTVTTDSAVVEFEFKENCLVYGYTKNGSYTSGEYDMTPPNGNMFIGITKASFVLDANKLSTEMPKADKTLERAWSPSALDIFFQCPRRFYLTKVLWLPEDEPDDPFMVLSAADIGTLAHAMMEELAAKDMPKADFLKLSEKAFNDFLVGRPPIHEDDADKERKEFLKMMDSAYDQDPHNEVISAEEEYTYDHPSGVKLHGFPDRVEKDKDGNLIIADFKSGRTITHIKNDIDTCFQVVVYAWLLEQAGTDISRCDYRYLRKNRTITCDYNDDMKNKLNEKLVQFKTAVETNDFPRNENETSCKYCKMRDICLWEGDI